MNQRIPLSYNPIDSTLLKEIIDGFGDRSHSDIVVEFENKIATITGSRYVVALQSGTAALHLGLKALQVSKEDEVITSTFTYVGSVNPILYLDARPVFVDCDLTTWNADPYLVEKAIVEGSKKPKAILVVHSYGMPANMDALRDISLKYSVPILEDAAEGIGAFYKGRHLGTIGDIGVLSFNNNKIITSYGGGALLTNNEDVYKKVKYWASQAREELPFYMHREVGYNYRLGSINAAAGLAAMSIYRERIMSSRDKFAFYRNSLTGPNYQFIADAEGFHSNHWLSTVLLRKDGVSAAKIQNQMDKQGIETRMFWNPMHKQPIFSHFKAFLNGNSESLFEIGLCLPSSYNLSKTDQNRVIESLRMLVN